jgi:hypothetical protein
MKDPQPSEESSWKQCQNYTNYENNSPLQPGQNK